MRLLPRTPAARRGFTLIELLVVIAAIAVLVGLLAVAVMGLIDKGPALQDRTDVSGLAAALQNFKAKHGFYPPSRIRLFASSSQYNPAKATHKDTLKAIGTMFLNINWNGIDWTGNNNPAAFPAAGILLEGDQCLVFFLGGIPGANGAPVGCTGFSTNPTNPAMLGGQRFKYFEFQPPRLTTAIHANNPFYSYVNAHGNKPYAYFSVGQRGQNQYNSVATGTGKTDCPTLGVNPYATAWGSPPTFVNPESFQVISAGLNGQFAPGSTGAASVWNPAAAFTVMDNVKGKNDISDDISNFSDRGLGVSQ